MSFPENQIAQSITFLRVAVRVGALPKPFKVAITEGQACEAEAWREAAIIYLIGKAKGLSFAQMQQNFREAMEDEQG